MRIDWEEGGPMEVSATWTVEPAPTGPPLGREAFLAQADDDEEEDRPRPRKCLS